MLYKTHGTVAQLVSERDPDKVEVGSSILPCPTSENYIYLDVNFKSNSY